MASKKTKKKTRNPFGSFLRALLWTACFLALLLTLDQLAVRLKPANPLLQELQEDYRVFRNRLIGKQPSPPLTIEALIERESTSPHKRPSGKQAKQPASPTARPAVPQSPAPTVATPAATSYLYVDKDGELQFADRLEEIPQALRGSAQPLQD